MKNPFPGMNPFLEQEWPGVHLRLLTYAADDLDGKLPDDLIVDGEMEVQVSRDDGTNHNYLADVGVKDESWKTGLPPVWSPANLNDSDEEASLPLLVELAENPPERWIEIQDRTGETITVIEFISPSNKTSHRKKYLQKRCDMVSSGINFVEIDLLRKGKRIVDIDESAWHRNESELNKTYHTCVNRRGFGNRREVYPCGLREKLPVIRIPLRQADSDVPLNLQALIDRCHQNRRYSMLDYAAELKPKLSGDDKIWVEDQMRTAGLIK